MSRTKKQQQPTRIEFETFYKIDGYGYGRIQQPEPDVFNGIVMVRKYRVVVELVEESPEVVFERLKMLWRQSDNHHHMRPLMDAAKELGFELDHSEYGKDRKR